MCVVHVAAAVHASGGVVAPHGAVCAVHAVIACAGRAVCACGGSVGIRAAVYRVCYALSVTVSLVC